MEYKNGQLMLRWCDNQTLVNTLVEAIDMVLRNEEIEMPILDVYQNGKWVEFCDDKDRTFIDILMSIAEPEKDIWISGEKYVFCTRCCEMMLAIDVEQEIDFEDGLPHATYTLECPTCKMQTTRRGER